MANLEVWVIVICALKCLQSKLKKRKQYSFFYITIMRLGDPENLKAE